MPLCTAPSIALFRGITTTTASAARNTRSRSNPRRLKCMASDMSESCPLAKSRVALTTTTILFRIESVGRAIPCSQKDSFPTWLRPCTSIWGIGARSFVPCCGCRGCRYAPKHGDRRCCARGSSSCEFAAGQAAIPAWGPFGRPMDKQQTRWQSQHLSLFLPPRRSSPDF